MAFLSALQNEVPFKETLTMLPASVRECVDFPILDDDVALEPPDMLAFTLEAETANVQVQQGSVFAAIVDDDGSLAGCIVLKPYFLSCLQSLV